MDTIYALSSGVGRAAVAVIRISGPLAGPALDTLAGGRPKPRFAALRILRDTAGAPIDQALVLWFAAPHSETGEDQAELQVHGGRAVIDGCFAALSACGLRLAEPGEFTRRAFMNGKLDLAEVEGLADLIAAETEAQRRQALAQAGGGLSARCEAWRETILNLRAEIEARIDFSDEGDVPDADDAAPRAGIFALREEIREALAGGVAAERVRDGLRVAILGPPNAGKSSLLNALAGRDAAIVTADAGTTRDVIEVFLDLGGYPVRLFDTAGLREAEAQAERIGVERSLATARTADIVLWLSPSGADDSPEPGLADTKAEIWKVRSKTDLGGPVPAGWTGVSAVRPDGCAELLARLSSRAPALMTAASGAVTRERHRAALADALGSLTLVTSGDRISANTPTEHEPPLDEIAAEVLRSAGDAIGRVAGRIGVEDVLDRLFSEFCIGK